MTTTTRRIFAVDPGDKESAWVELQGTRVHAHGYEANPIVQQRIADAHLGCHVAIEMIASYGMGVGQHVFETCLWVGRFDPDCRAQLVYRYDVKMHLNHVTRAKDGNVRLALIDMWGGPAAVGKKANPGPLYGITGDTWQALAVAVYVRDTWL